MNDTVKLQSTFDLENVQNWLEPLGVHRPKDGHVITEVTSVKCDDLIGRAMGIHAVYDIIDKRLFFRVLDLQSGKFYPEIEQILQNGIEQDQHHSDDENSSPGRQVLDVMEVVQKAPAGEPDTELSKSAEYVNEIETIVRERLKEERAASERGRKKQKKADIFVQGTAGPEAPKLEWLTDAEIRPRFLKAIETAKQSIIIVSPWVNDIAVDNSLLTLFRKAAKRRVLTLMGWGIKYRMSDEEKVPSDELIKKIRQIRTPEKAPAAGLIWVGNQHRKEVIVDRRIQLLGSHNWLSYRGDWNIRGESAFYVENHQEIKKALSHIEGLLGKALKREWGHFLKQRSDCSRQELCALGWAALRREEAAIHAVGDLLKNGSEGKNAAAELLTLLCRCLKGRALSSEGQLLDGFIKELNQLIESHNLIKKCNWKVDKLMSAIDSLSAD